MIKVDIKLQRKNFAVEINETFSSGITGIYGPSGSGKTSLLYAIAGLVNPDRGMIEINGNCVYDTFQKKNTPVEKRNIGYLFQEGRLFPHMTVKQNLLYGIKADFRQDVLFDEVVEMLNLRHLLASKPVQISGGERQRTALGRAILSSPRILLLDEPFSAVDQQLRSSILPFILRIHKRFSIPILVVSHDLVDILKLTDRLMLIKNGRVTAHGRYHELLVDKSVSEILTGNRILNTFDVRTIDNTRDTGLTLFENNSSYDPVLIKCDKSRQNYKLSEKLRIFIYADDVALSLKLLRNISTQNQIEGRIVSIIDKGSMIYCVIDAGVELIAEITHDSFNRMNLSKGKKVFCLFKSTAIDVIG